ncbi:MAG TPA: hypothetical protein VIJ94_01295 [Caulobacteraceae bacterium]
MSFLSQSLNQIEHGQIAEWAKYAIGYIKRRIGQPLPAQAAEAAVTDIEGFKSVVETAAGAYLTAKLGPFGGPLAANVADHAVQAVATTLEAATRALEAQPTGAPVPQA